MFPNGSFMTKFSDIWKLPSSKWLFNRCDSENEIGFSISPKSFPECSNSGTSSSDPGTVDFLAKGWFKILPCCSGSLTIRQFSRRY